MKATLHTDSTPYHVTKDSKSKIDSSKTES